MVALRTAFDRQLNALEGDVRQIASMVERQLADAVQALQTRDTALAQSVIDMDVEVNRLRYEVEEQSYLLLALQQPTAGDMRRIVACVSIATNLERMGDHAAGIARLALRLCEQPVALAVPAFSDMASRAIANLRLVMEALEKQDADLARKVVQYDWPIDGMHRQVYEQMIQTMIGDPGTVECATMLLWVSHNLERYADRILNISERVIYMVTGVLHEARIDPMP
ncbi:MAG: phosphate signaling complex protein PhoU [Anaerolineae bacterium]|nr:phosphate signaling complex protein PhoU [Anaerolineae bacterium]